MRSFRHVGLVVLFPLVYTACFEPRFGDAPALDAALDAAMFDAAMLDAALMDALPPALGTEHNPARSCVELRDLGMTSGAYWIRPEGQLLPFQAYCEQELEGGGWAMVYNSVRREDGATAAFWQLKYADRLSARGVLAPDQNYYNGALYRRGIEYMDVFVDMADRTVVAARMTAAGINETTMQFIEPMFVDGHGSVYLNQFASEWSAQDCDGVACNKHCAEGSSNVAQHYHRCWAYNLASDGGDDRQSGNPHVDSGVLNALGLATQPPDPYSQVKRIARFTRDELPPAGSSPDAHRARPGINQLE